MLNAMKRILSACQTQKFCRGTVRMAYYPIDPKTGAVLLHKPEVVAVKKNLILYGGAEIMARVVGGDAKYKVSAMYFEFTNGVAPVVTPTRDQGLAYYRTLPNPKDYLRVSMSINASIMSTDNTLYVNGGNQLTFFALTSTNDNMGQLGRVYSDAAPSTVYGAALAATPDIGTPANDVVFSRVYFDTAFPKVAGKQLGCEWAIKFN